MRSVREYRSLEAEEKEIRAEDARRAGEIREELEAIKKAVDKLPSDQRRLIRMRYFWGWRWEKVARNLNYSRSETFRIHKRALRAMEAETEKETTKEET